MPDRKLPKIKLSDLRRFCMHTYARKVDLGYAKVNPKEIAPCGTEACFAGWGYLLQFPKRKWRTYIDKANIHEQARMLFGFTDGEADKVFVGRGLEALGGASFELVGLKADINEVLEERGMKQRVK